MGSRKPFACCYFHTSEDMREVKDKSVKLMIGASAYLGGDVRDTWDSHVALYDQVYIKNGMRVLREDGYLVIIQTDAYYQGRVFPRNIYLPRHIEVYSEGLHLLDVKIWERRRADFFQVPYSQVFVYGRDGAKRPKATKSKAYFQGIWRYPQTKGGELNAYPEDLCRLLVGAFTEPGDLIVDPFAGTGMLLGVARRMDRSAIGYEINKKLKSLIKHNIEREPCGLAREL